MNRSGPPHEPSEAGRVGKGEAAEYPGSDASGRSRPTEHASPWELPTSLQVGGMDCAIRTDWRDVLYVLDVFADPEYEQDEKTAICLRVIYRDFDELPPELYQQAADRAAAFIDAGLPADGRKKSPRLVDWEQDGPMLIPAVNRVLGREVRSMPYLHWWTFVGAYMELGECLFSTVLGLRQKRAKGKKLEKHEQAFLRENRALVELRMRQTEDDAACKAALRELFV